MLKNVAMEGSDETISTVKDPERADVSSHSNDYSKYGIKDVPKYTTTTALGKTKTFAGLFPKEWVFLIVSSVNILSAIGLTIYRMVIVIQDDPESSDFTFTLLLLINAGFCIFYVVHGVLRERVYELYAFMAAILVVMMYCILDYWAFNEARQTTVKLVRVIMVIVMAPPNIILAYIVSRNFGYLEFRIVGASEYLQKLYRQAAVFSCLLKFDLQAASSIVILALKDGTKMSLLETVSLAIGLPYSLLWCLLGWVSPELQHFEDGNCPACETEKIKLRREFSGGAILFAVLGFVKPAYYIYKIVIEYKDLLDDKIHTEDNVVYSLLAAVTVGFLVWLMLMFELRHVYRNFGKGLKERAQLLTNENTGLLAASRARWSSR